MSQDASEVWPNGPPRVGQSASLSRTVQARDIELFTALSGDSNPLHYDQAIAKSTKVGGIIVQGGVTSAILNAVVAEELPGPGSVFLMTRVTRQDGVVALQGDAVCYTMPLAPPKHER